jgi:hypothetical protein
LSARLWALDKEHILKPIRGPATPLHSTVAAVRLTSPPRALVVVARPRRLPPSNRQRDWQRGPQETSLSSTSSAYTRKRLSLYRISKRTIGKGSVTITWCRDSDFLCRYLVALGHGFDKYLVALSKDFVECPTKSIQ